MAVAVTSNNTTTVDYVTTDQLNTPRAITDASQTLEWSWASDPFGNGQPTGSLTYNLRFPGQYYDAETGHNYNYRRDYDPSTGRYIESDPTGLRGGINTYSYAYDNPVSYGDFYGLCPNDCKDLLAKINNLRNELAKRESDLYQDQYDLSLLGRMSIYSHQNEFRNKQKALRRTLDEYNSQGCDDDDLPPGTWNYATMPPPFPAGKDPGVFNMGPPPPAALGGAAAAALIIGAIILSPVGI